MYVCLAQLTLSNVTGKNQSKRKTLFERDWEMESNDAQQDDVEYDVSSPPTRFLCFFFRGLGSCICSPSRSMAVFCCCWIPSVLITTLTYQHNGAQ